MTTTPPDNYGGYRIFLFFMGIILTLGTCNSAKAQDSIVYLETQTQLETYKAPRGWEIQHRHQNDLIITLKEKPSLLKRVFSNTVEDTIADTFIPTRNVILEYKEGKRVDAERFCASLNAHKTGNDDHPDFNIMVVRLPAGLSFSAFQNAAMQTPCFVTVAQDAIIEMKQEFVANPNDMFFPGQYVFGIHKIQEAIALLPAGSHGTVAILDGCNFQLDHPDLGPSALDGSLNAVTGGPITMPTQYEKHATACMGLISEVANNSIGAAGIGLNNLDVMAICMGYGSTSGGSFFTNYTIILRALQAAWDNPNVRAISNSWGSGNAYTGVDALITKITNTITFSDGKPRKGIAVFASTGNASGRNVIQYPAWHKDVFQVGASTQGNTKAGFTNYGTHMHFVCFGVGLRTTDVEGSLGYTSSSDPNSANYYGFSGTSASCPIMSGIFAILSMANDTLTVAQRIKILAETCIRPSVYTWFNADAYHPYGKWCEELGYGIPNAYEAVRAAQGYVAPPPPPIKPNYFLSNCSFTGTGKPGTQITVTARVNATLSTIPVETEFRWSLDGGFQTSDLLIGKATGAPGDFVSVTYTVPSTAVGTMYVMSKTDNQNAVVEENESDNTCSAAVNTSVPIPSGLDCKLDFVGVTWVTDSTAKYQFLVTNVGSENAVAPSIQFGILPAQNGASSANTVLPTKSVVITTAAVKVPKIGNNTLTAKINKVSGYTGDANSSNNSVTTTIVRIR